MHRLEFSCIKQVIKTVTLTLPPNYISNEIAGVTEILDSWKRQYIQQLQGVLVSYKNVSLASHTGFIHIDKAHVRFDVTAAFDVFCPSEGDIVKGKINRTSREHIGCLIQDTINVTIHLSNHTPVEFSKYIQVNREILFQITHFDFNRSNIRVNGQITERCVQLMEELFPEVKEEKTENLKNSSVNLKNMLHEDKSSSSESSDDKPNTLKLFSSASVLTTSTPVAHSSTSSDEETDISKSSSSTMVNSQQSIKPEILTDMEMNFSEEPYRKENTFKHLKKRKKDNKSTFPDRKSKKHKSSDSSLSETLKKSKKKAKHKLCEKESNTAKFSVGDKSLKKKKHKEKSKISPDKEIKQSNILDKNVRFSNELGSSFANSDISNHITIQQNIKKEAMSPTKLASTSSMSTDKGKKRKRESSLSDAPEASHKKKKKHKEKGSKIDSKKPKNKKKGKSTPGNVLKKDKKKSHKKQHAKNEKDSGKSEHKSKKGHKKKKSSRKEDSSNLMSFSQIKSE